MRKFFVFTPVSINRPLFTIVRIISKRFVDIVENTGLFAGKSLLLPVCISLTGVFLLSLCGRGLFRRIFARVYELHRPRSSLLPAEEAGK